MSICEYVCMCSEVCCVLFLVRTMSYDDRLHAIGEVNEDEFKLKETELLRQPSTPQPTKVC